MIAKGHNETCCSLVGYVYTVELNPVAQEIYKCGHGCFMICMPGRNDRNWTTNKSVAISNMDLYPDNPKRTLYYQTLLDIFREFE